MTMAKVLLLACLAGVVLSLDMFSNNATKAGERPVEAGTNSPVESKKDDSGR